MVDPDTTRSNSSKALPISQPGRHTSAIFRSSHHQLPTGGSVGSLPRNALPHPTTGQLIDKRVALYKTEMCRTWEETGVCKYGAKCQFAHDRRELRALPRHPRYKTEICKTFWQQGTCPYGKRCCFIHDEYEAKPVNDEESFSISRSLQNDSAPISIPNFESRILQRLNLGDLIGEGSLISDDTHSDHSVSLKFGQWSREMMDVHSPELEVEEESVVDVASHLPRDIAELLGD